MMDLATIKMETAQISSLPMEPSGQTVMVMDLVIIKTAIVPTNSLQILHNGLIRMVMDMVIMPMEIALIYVQILLSVIMWTKLAVLHHSWMMI